MSPQATSERRLDQFAEPVLAALLVDSGWSITEFQHQAVISPHAQVDHVAHLQSGQVQASLLIETEPNPRPQSIKQKVLLLQTQRGHAKALSVAIFVERITTVLAESFRSLGLGYFDLYGACLLHCPGLYIERPGQDRPLLSEAEWPGLTGLLRKGKEGLSAQSVFGTRSLMRHRVLRALLSYPDRKWHQNELAQKVDVDPGSHVNRVVKFLLQEHYADYEGRGPGKVIFITRPGELLDTWAGYWQQMWNALRRASCGFLSLAMNADDVKADLIRSAATTGSQLGFTLTAGSDYFGSYLRDDQVHAHFGGNIHDLSRAADLDAIDRGANVILLPAKDPGVFYLPQELLPANAPVTAGHAGPVCPVQLYLDMRGAGGRYAEQAEVLRKEVLRY